MVFSDVYGTILRMVTIAVSYSHFFPFFVCVVGRFLNNIRETLKGNSGNIVSWYYFDCFVKVRLYNYEIVLAINLRSLLRENWSRKFPLTICYPTHHIPLTICHPTHHMPSHSPYAIPLTICHPTHHMPSHSPYAIPLTSIPLKGPLFPVK